MNYLKKLLSKDLYIMMESAPKAKGLQSFNHQIRFNLSSHDLQCFISKHPKSRSNPKRTSKNNNITQPFIKLIQERSSNRNHNVPYFDFGFDHKVLFTHYGSLEVYVDEQPNNQAAENSIHDNQTQDLQSEQVVSQCLRAISQDTNDNSNCSFSSGQAFNFNNQQMLELNRSRSRQNNEQPVFSIRPLEVQLDGRTTLMLRNIPNKYTQQMVLQEVQAAGLQLKYDFFYLPIDFKNDCNVGYAFINLIDVRYVKQLYSKFHGKKWPRFNSEKICQVCYARIQGTPQLLSHFRFSNTLQRDNRYRPLIYLNLNLAQIKTDDAQAKNDKNFSFTI